MAAHADVIAQIEQLKKLKSPLSDHIFLHVNLNPFPGALQMGKTRFPHQAIGNDAPCDANFSFVRFQFRSLRGSKLPDQIRGGVGPAKFSRKCFKSKSLYLLQFFLTLFELIARLELQVEIPFPGGCRRSIKAGGWIRQGTLA